MAIQWRDQCLDCTTIVQHILLQDCRVVVHNKIKEYGLPKRLRNSDRVTLEMGSLAPGYFRTGSRVRGLTGELPAFHRHKETPCMMPLICSVMWNVVLLWRAELDNADHVLLSFWRRVSRKNGQTFHSSIILTTLPLKGCGSTIAYPSGHWATVFFAVMQQC